MSKLWKSVKKVFRKVGKFVKKHWKVIVIAAAVYFTAGIALAAMPSTAAFSAAMPGFGVGGVFSNAAVAMGATGAAGSGIAGTVAANAAAAITGAGVTTAGAAAMPVATTSAATAAGAPIAGTATTGALAGGTVATAAPAAAAASTVAAKTGFIAGMSGLEKVALAATVFKGAGGLLADSEDDVNRKQHNRQNAQSFGIGRDGKGPGWGGAANDAFSGRFGSEEEAEPTEGDATPFSATPVPQQGTTPFSNMAQSEQEAGRDKAAVGGGFKRGDYMPT